MTAMSAAILVNRSHPELIRSSVLVCLTSLGSYHVIHFTQSGIGIAQKGACERPKRATPAIHPRNNFPRPRPPHRSNLGLGLPDTVVRGFGFARYEASSRRPYVNVTPPNSFFSILSSGISCLVLHLSHVKRAQNSQFLQCLGCGFRGCRHHC